MKSAHKGFTLVELIVVMAVFSVIVGVGLVMSMDALARTTRSNEVDTMVSVLQRARSRAMANIKQSPWGVHYSATDHVYTIFRGKTVASNPLDNDVVSGSSAASVTIPGDIVFTQLSGTTTGTFAATVTQNGQSSPVSVNYEGAIIW